MEAEKDPAEGRVGSVLDAKWTLERVLGSGGMGAVYAARHRNGARAAVKVLHPELARRPDVRERFLREGYAANRVEHRGAVQVLDDDIIKEGPDEGLAYLVMEMLEGESLEERLERGPPLTELELLPILNDVLAVLESAHENGVVHRDLKPANLFLNKDPTGFSVKVLDFGLARLAEARSMTSAGLALGTPSFMAPEQANGKKDEIDARSDIFAIGATAFMILSGRGVHEADGVLELVARMGTLPAPKLREIAPQVSEKVARIVDRALEFRREDRYPSAALMRADVQSALEDLTPGAAPEELPPTSKTQHRAPAPPVAPVASSDHPAATRRRSGAVVVLAGLVAAGVVLVIAVPQARDRAFGDLLSASSIASARRSTSALASGSVDAASAAAPVDGSAPPSAAELLATATADASATGEGIAIADAATDAPDATSQGDASAEDDDEDDLDASADEADVKPLPARPGQPVHAGAPRGTVTKHAKPAAPSHGKRPAPGHGKRRTKK